MALGDDHPSLNWGAREIEEFLERNPETLYRIFGDMYSIVKDEERKARGQRRVGRRPVAVASSIDEMMQTIFPDQFSTEPFPRALANIMNGQSQRSFSSRVPCHQTTLSRLMAGSLQPDVAMMERIAEAARVHPSYFMEWRAEAVSEVIRGVLQSDPELSIRVLQEVRR